MTHTLEPRRSSGILLLVAAAALFLAGACTRSPAPTTKAAKPADSPAAKAVADVADGSARLLDVRRPDEWAAGHAVGAVHLALDRIQAGELPSIDKTERVYVYCRTGNRSGQAIDILEKAGYTELVNMGGLRDWEAAGGPVSKGA